MPLPQVTCGADYQLAYSASPRVISLSASATEGPDQYRWSIIGKPVGSVVDSGVHGDFVDGVSTLQNPTVQIDGALDGGYTFQCLAHNNVGWSDPDSDKGSGQQVIIVTTQNRLYTLPAPKMFDFETPLLNSMRLIEADIVTLRGGPEAFYSPENVPKLVWYSNSVMQIDHWDDRSNTLRLRLSDGKWYTADATTPLTIDFAITGRGGREVSTSDPEIVSTFYHVYAVPSLTPNQFVCMASVIAPPTGISDLPAWRYIGTVFNNSASNLRRFIQVTRDVFHWIDMTEEALEVYVGFAVSPPLNTWIDTGSAANAGAPISGTSKVRAIKYAAPADDTAQSVLLAIMLDTSTPYLFLDGGPSTDVLWTPPTTASFPIGWGALGASSGGQRTTVEREIAVRSGQVKFYWRAGTTFNWSVMARGYRDRYLIAGEL